MAKAVITLPDGTQVQIDGSSDEIAKVLQLYGRSTTPSTPGTINAPIPKPSRKSTRKRSTGQNTTKKSNDQVVDTTQIVNLVKTCDEAEAIEEKILDRTSQVNRALLPLYIVHEHLDNAIGLTSGDVDKVTTELGIRISTANAGRTLSRTASRYVMADRARKKGVPIRYKLSRRGVAYLKQVISGDNK